MTKHLPLLLFIGLAWGQDKYPYFSDMGKQLEFERKKIIIEEGQDVQQIISGGGSQFNWWSLFIEREPIYKNAPIETSYKYLSNFSVSVNRNQISEVELMSLIGLENEAEEILENYKYQIKNFDNQLKQVNFNQIYYPYKYSVGFLYGLFGLHTIVGTSLIFHKDDNYFRTTEGFSSLVIIIYLPTYGLSKWYKSIKKENFQKVSYSEITPQINQVMSHAQIKSISEAYNRKLYGDISKK